jgi:thioesterase superfamily protein 4
MDATITRLSSVPWAAALINDPDWTPIETGSRSVKASGEDAFFGGTLGTDRTIRTLLTLRPKDEGEGDIVYKEIKTIVELGEGVQGYPQIAHGGFQATLLDEMCGILIMTNMERKAQRLTEDGRRTPALNYVTACSSIPYINTGIQAEHKQI